MLASFTAFLVNHRLILTTPFAWHGTCGLKKNCQKL